MTSHSWNEHTEPGARSSVRAAVAATALLAAVGVTTAAPSFAAPAHTRAAAQPAAAATERGALVLIGGALKEDPEILERIVALADPDGAGPRKARIAIVTAAAAPAENAAEAADADENNAAANGLYYADLFARYGAATYAVPVDTTENAFPGDAYGPAAADRATVAREVRRSTGVFFGGGDQMDYVRTLQHCRPAPLEAFTHCTPSAVLSAVGDLLDEGGVVAGVSAGTTIQQGADMITGGESYEAWRDGATPGYLDDPAALGYLPSGGFGFFSGAMLDSHFTTWGRQARMIRLAADTGHRHVIGIDETTALVVRRQSRQAEVIGRHGVSILEVTPRTTGWTYLTAGDRVDLRTWKVRPAPHSSALVGTGPAAAPVVDVWDSATADEPGSYTLRNLAVDLVHSTAREASGTTYEDGPRYRTVLRRTSATSAWEHGNVTSFADLELDIATTG